MTHFNLPRAISAALVVAACFSCKPKTDATQQAEANAGETAAVVKALDMSNFDASIKPTNDFYGYANGGWMKKTEIPASESRWGSFNELVDNNKKIVAGILQEAAKKTDAKKGSNEQLVGDFYASGMDSAGINNAAVSPLKPYMDEIDAISDLPSLIKLLAKHQQLRSYPAFGVYVFADKKNSKMNAAYAYQGGTALPDRDYYLEKSERYDNIRSKYVEHIAKIFVLMGIEAASAKKQAETIMKMETRMAKASMPRVEMRDPEKTYNKMTLDQANKLTPNFDWKQFMTMIGAAAANEIIVATPAYFKELDKMFKDTKTDEWKSYVKWHFITSYAPYLSDAFVTENYAFFNETLQGAKEQKPRWKKVSETSDANLGDALGQLYVAKAFSASDKAKANEMVNNLREAFAERIKGLDWMTDETKTQALKKLASFRQKIGYTDKWNSYEGLDINRSSYVLNVLNSNIYEYKRDMAKLGKAVDKEEWGMTPATVNAYYNPLNNEIVFPAGILQPPFFNSNADDAVNYGGIGAVIGHEISHGFDDSGCQYDSEGNLKNWWTETDKKKFEEKTAKLIEQFNAYTVLDTVKVNGKLTLGENIADLGGLAVAYDAFKKQLAKTGKTELIDGLTPEQRFFMGWAQVWRIKFRDEALMERIKTDSHAPGHLRAHGPLTNLEIFYKAFDAKEGDAMYKKPEDRILIW